MKIAFIGLGIMGRPMVRNLLKNGYDVTVFDVSPKAVEELNAANADIAPSLAEACKEADIIITMLPNSPEVKQVVLGESGVIDVAKQGAILVDMSSIDPMVSIEISAELAKKGIHMLDAPVSGGEPKAIDGSLSIMVGGDREIFDRVKSILLCMGSSVVLVGKIGSGNVTKLSNQIIVALNIAAMCEAYILASKAGVDIEKVYDAIKGGLAGSVVLDAKTPKILARNFNPGFRINLHIKDLNNVMDSASKLGLELPLSKAVLDMMKALDDKGVAGDDHSGLIKYYENLNNYVIE